jgi:hypothetical protein
MARRPAPTKTLTAPKTSAQQERAWRAQSALESIKRAEQVKSDPNLMRDVKALARQEQQALARVTGRPGKR